MINDIDDVTETLGISNDVLSEPQLADLDRDGFLILPPDPKHLAKFDTNLKDLGDIVDGLVKQEGESGGWEGLEFVIAREPGKLADPGSNRLCNLINKNKKFRSLISMPEVLVAAKHILQQQYRVSAVDMREPQKNGGFQKIHLDWQPRFKETDPWDCMFCYFVIDDVTVDNGALRVIPGTHKNFDYPDEYINTGATHPDEIYAEVEAGSRIIVNSLVWHSGTENKSGARRRTFFTEYRPRTIPQLLNQQLYLSDEIKGELDEVQSWLLSVGPDYPIEKIQHLGPGDAYRERYNIKSAHEVRNY